MQTYCRHSRAERGNRRGPVVEKPNMSGAEFAALLETLPEAQQRKIEAVVDLFLAERDQ